MQKKILTNSLFTPGIVALAKQLFNSERVYMSEDRFEANVSQYQIRCTIEYITKQYTSMGAGDTNCDIAKHNNSLL